MNILTALIRKEFLQELRSREILLASITYALLVSVLSAIGVHGGFINTITATKISPMLIWLTFLVAATNAIGRSFQPEIEHGAIDLIRIAKVPAPLIFVSKWLPLSTILIVTVAVIALTLNVLLDLSLPLLSPSLFFLAITIALGYSALAVLFSPIATHSNIGSLLLPLVLTPLLFPLFLAAIEHTATILSGGNSSFWFSFAALLSFLYVLLGLNLYQFVIEE